VQANLSWKVTEKERRSLDYLRIGCPAYLMERLSIFAVLTFTKDTIAAADPGSGLQSLATFVATQGQAHS
jgi:hypothetical protein